VALFTLLILVGYTLGFPVLYSTLMKNRSYALKILNKEEFNDKKTPHRFETEISFGSQKIIFGNVKERSIDDLRSCALSLLSLDRQKISV